MTNQLYYVKEEAFSVSDIDVILKNKKRQLIQKRIFDIIVSSMGLILLFPFFVIIALIIKMDSKGSVFFRQVRIGKDEKAFRIFKFRTMISDAEQKGLSITVGKDSRITKSGHFIRKLKIDELPQLINVFIGDMSFVGPRPEVPKYVSQYTENQKGILKVRPGITDLASIEYRDENEILAKVENPEMVYVNEIMVKKLELNYIYLKKLSVFYDIMIIIKTVLLILSD